MSAAMLYGLAGFSAVALFAYLIWALVRAEEF